MSKSEEAMHGITFKDKIGYAMGDMGGLLTFGLVSAFLNMFYTDVLGISAARITVLMIVARIWDAVNDPMWGSFIDSRKPTKYGRFRPYILWASLPPFTRPGTESPPGSRAVRPPRPAAACGRPAP